jgi:uncharacterized protein
MSNLVQTLLSTAPLVHRDASPGGMIKRAKYCLRGLAFARHTGDWFDFLRNSDMAFIVKNNPSLYHKLQRPYLDRTLNTGERLEVLKQHYQFILTHFSTKIIEDVYVPGGKLLAELPVKNVGVLELRLICGSMQKEGDLTIRLTNKESGKRIAHLSFSIRICAADRKEIFIGGLQGDVATKEDVVVAITRGLYGLRPKALVLYVLQQLAACWKITHLRAVSDDMHIYRHFQTKRNVAASYDEFWVECGGTLASDGTYDLPVAFVPRNIPTIRANKRQLYKRRYAMLKGTEDQIVLNMLGIKRDPLPGTEGDQLAA